MQLKIVLAHIVQVMDDAGNVLKSHIIPGDKVSIDTIKNKISSSSQDFDLVSDELGFCFSCGAQIDNSMPEDIKSNGKIPSSNYEKLKPPRKREPHPHDFIKSNKDLTDRNHILTFGKKWAGTSIKEVPESYLIWGKDNITNLPDVVERFKIELQYRTDYPERNVAIEDMNKNNPPTNFSGDSDDPEDDIPF